MSPAIDAVNVIGEPKSTSDGQLTEMVGQGGRQFVQAAIVTVVVLTAVCALPSLTSTLAV
jgi:hypothetical protein